jgi:hypothetical protein
MTTYFGLRMHTTLPLGDMEAWAEDNCIGAFRLQIEDIQPDLRHKTVRLYFEQPDDRDAFKAAFHALSQAVEA